MNGPRIGDNVHSFILRQAQDERLLTERIVRP
jgi:hypothetical protein